MNPETAKALGKIGEALQALSSENASMRESLGVMWLVTIGCVIACAISIGGVAALHRRLDLVKRKLDELHERETD